MTTSHAAGTAVPEREGRGDDRAADYATETLNVPREASTSDAPYDFPTIASAPSGMVLLAGVWLMISRFVFDYPGAGATTHGAWNGMVIGGVVALAALLRLATATSSPVISLVNVVLGGWMIASPWIFGYSPWGTSWQPAWSDVITGLVIVICGLASWSGGTMRRFGVAGPGA